MIFSGGGFIDALLIIGLPNGPTAHFKLSKLVLRKDIKVSCFFCQKLYVYLFSNSRNNMFLLVYTMQVVAVASLPKEIAAGLHPKQNNTIRALLLQSGWVVERLEDDSCMVTYVIQVSISKIINSSTKKQKQKLRFLFILWITLNIKLS